MPFKYNSYTGKLDYYEETSLPVVPDNQVFFSTNLPTDGGVVFTPNTPALENTLYISETTSQVYTYADGVYSTYVSPIPNNTAWYITGTTIDAGGNKSTSITRKGDVILNHATNAQNFRAITGTRGIYMKSNPSGNNVLYSYNGGLLIGTSSVDAVSIASSNTERIGVSAAGVVKFNNAYSFPTTDGTANYFLKTNGAGVVSWAAAGLSYFTEAQATTSPNNTVYANSLTAVSSTTNADFAILAKGSGAILARMPDGTGTGGNKRGLYALDLSRYAGASGTYIAAGDYDIILGGSRNSSNTGTYSFIANGDYNSCTGTYGTILNGNNNSVTGARAIVINGQYNQANGAHSMAGAGLYNYANGSSSVALCGGNTASGTSSFAIGTATLSSGSTSFATGYGSVADGYNGFAIGDYGWTNGIRNKFAIGGSGWGLGMTQAAITQLDGRTTDATPTVLQANTQNSGGIATSVQFTLPNNSLMRIKGSIQGKQSGSTNCAVWDFDAVMVRSTTASTTAIVGTPSITLIANTGNFGTPTLTANTTLGCLTVTVTGVLATNIQWGCRIDSTESIYA